MWRLTFSSFKASASGSGSGSGTLGASGAAPIAIIDTRTAFFAPCSSGADADVCASEELLITAIITAIVRPYSGASSTACMVSKGTLTAVIAPCSSCADADVCKQHINPYKHDRSCNTMLATCKELPCYDAACMCHHTIVACAQDLSRISAVGQIKTSAKGSAFTCRGSLK